MKVIIILLILIPLGILAQNQIIVTGASSPNANGVFEKYTGATYIGGIQNDSNTEIFIKGNYPNSGTAIYRFQNKWIHSQFSSSIVFGLEILDFTNTVQYEFQSTELKPPCLDTWLKISNTTLESLTLVGYCFSINNGIFISNDELKFLCSGGTTEISLTLSGNLLPNDNYKIQLSDENGSFQNSVIIADTNSNNVKVTYPNLIESGNYKIRAITILLSLDSVKSNEVALSQNMPDLYTLYTGGVHCKGSTAEIDVSANYSFQVDKFYYYFGDSLITNSNNSTLFISNISEENQGHYKARIEKNGCLGPFSNNYLLSVSDSPSLKWPNTTDFEKAYCTSGNSYTINTTAWYFGRVMRGSTLSWTKDGVVIPGEGQNQHYIPNVNTSSTGKYQFKITNTACVNPTFTSDSIFVGIVDKPVLKESFPDTVNVCQGSTAGLFANHLNQSISYTWQKNEVNMLNQPYSTLSVNSFEQQNEGSYRVILKSFGCTDSTISNSAFLKYIQRPQTPSLTPSGQVLTVLDSLQIDITPKSQFSYSLQSGFVETSLNNAATTFLKESGAYYAIITDSLGCKSDLSVPLQITFDKTQIELVGSSVTEINGLYKPISSLPFNVVPDINTKFYSKGDFVGPDGSAYYIFRKNGTWRIIRYTVVIVFPEDPPNINTVQFFSSISPADSVICDMNWIKTATSSPEDLNFRGACPLLASLSNGSESTETACGQFTLPSGQTATSSGIYSFVTPNRFGADSTIITNLTINTIPIASIFGNATILPGQSTNLTINISATPPFQLGFNNTTITSPNNTLEVSVTPTITTTYILSSVSNIECGIGTVTGAAVVTIDPNLKCPEYRQFTNINPQLTYGIYKALTFISSSVPMLPNTVLKAEKTITLEQGFQAIPTKGGVILMEIGGCEE